MKFTGSAVVIVGQPDEDRAPYSQRDVLGVNVWGPMPYAEAETFAREAQAEFDRVQREDPGAFVFGTPIVRLERCVVSDRALDAVQAAREAARNWYRPLDERDDADVDV
jgi:hypothetical protein